MFYNSFSQMKLEFLISWRYFKSKRREKFISTIGVFSLIGVILGVSTLVIVTSVMNGFREEFTSRLIGFNGHITVIPAVDKINDDQLVDKLKSIEGVEYVFPEVDQHALVSNKSHLRATAVYGVNYKDLLDKAIISRNIVCGDLRNFKNHDEIVLGETLAKKIGISVGDSVVLITPKSDSTGFGFVPRKKTFKVVACFNCGMHEYDSSVSFINIKMAKNLFKLHEDFNSVSLFVKDPRKISFIRKNIRDMNINCSVCDWQTSNSSFMKAVEIEKNVMFLILTMITLVASFCVIACMIMLVKDKEKDIAILRTIGLERCAVMRIFLIIGSSIGVIGTVLGCVIGIIFSINIESIRQFLQKILCMNLFSEEIYYLTQLPSVIDYDEIFFTAIVSILISCIATIYPARRASNLNPVEVLRYA